MAIAADSTGTIVQADGAIRRTYETTNKVFTLSKYHPVGVMTYGNLELMGVPWETVVKIFRQQLGKKSFDTIDEYKSALIGFLEHNRSLFPESAQRFWFKVDVVADFVRLKREIESKLQKTKARSKTAKQRLYSQEIERRWKQSDEAPPIDGLSKDFASRLQKEFVAEISGAILDAFASDINNITPDAHGQLQRTAVNLFARKCIDDHRVADVGGGVVICGFGEMEAFPSVIPFRCQRILLDKLLYRDELGYKPVLGVPPAAILPFAQRDVVLSFLRGVDPGFHRLVEGAFTQFVRGQTDVVIQEIAKYTGKPVPLNRQAELKSELESKYIESVKSISDGMQRYTAEKHVDPLLQVLSVAPKEELAVIAEALVSLTAIKRKMSLEWPTVGGPIDTAVISKGDGFVWISRKHYFSPELNPTFARKYFD